MFGEEKNQKQTKTIREKRYFQEIWERVLIILVSLAVSNFLTTASLFDDSFQHDPAERVAPTFAGCRRDPDADKVLEGQHAGQEAAVLGPDLSDGFPPAFVHDGDQSEGVKHGVEVHPLPDDVDSQQQAGLRGTGDTCAELDVGIYAAAPKALLTCLYKYLQAELVKEVVDEVFDEADDASVQVLPRDVVEDNARSRRRQFVPQPVVHLVAVDGHLER